jgi:hypothetical protein
LCPRSWKMAAEEWFTSVTRQLSESVGNSRRRQDIRRRYDSLASRSSIASISTSSILMHYVLRSNERTTKRKTFQPTFGQGPGWWLYGQVLVGSGRPTVCVIFNPQHDLISGASFPDNGENSISGYRTRTIMTDAIGTGTFSRRTHWLLAITTR